MSGPTSRSRRSKVKVRDTELARIGGPSASHESSEPRAPRPHGEDFKFGHTSFRLEPADREMLKELASKVYGGTTNAVVMRLLIRAAYAKFKNAEFASVTGAAEVRPETASIVAEREAANRFYGPPLPSTSTQDDLREPIHGLSQHDALQSAQLDDGPMVDGIPRAMIDAWGTLLDHRPFIPGLRRIWAWVQSRERELRKMLVTMRNLRDEAFKMETQRQPATRGGRQESHNRPKGVSR